MPGLREDLEGEGGEGGGRRAQEGGGMCMSMAFHADVWQRPSQYCKIITL